MSVGDTVMMNLRAETWAEPYMGIVQAEDGDPGGTATVLWRKTGDLSTIPKGRLSKVWDAPLGAKQVGQWAQLLGWPESEFEPPDDVEGFAPKSPAAAGVIVDAFVLSVYGDTLTPTDPGYVVIATEDGRGTFVVEYSEQPIPSPEFEAAYVIQPGRRNV